MSITIQSKEPKRAILWDVDGTIVDSAEHHWRAWRVTLLHEGLPITRNAFDASFGKRNDSALHGFFGRELSVEEVKRISSAKEKLYRKLITMDGLKLLPGVMRWLGYLRNEGWRQCVASSAPRKNLEAILNQLNIGYFFDAVVSAEEITHGKPHPAIFLRAAERVGVDPQLCIVIEDAPTGIEAARRACMRTIGVLTTHSQLDADIVVESLDLLSPSVVHDLAL
jgi:beta-phosphoglucomutase